MVIRRIRDHVASHNWFAVSIDLLIVVVGVFLGTQATNWNDARIAANNAHIYRERLIEDISANQIDFVARRLYYTDVRHHALAALRALQSPGSVSDERLIVDAYQASQINARRFRRSTYDELVADGSLSQLGDQPIRDVAEAYYLGLLVLDDDNAHLPPYRERIRRELPYEVINQIRTQCGDRTSDMNGVVVFKLPSDCQLNLDPQLIALAAARLRDAPQIDRDLSRYIVDIDQRLSNFVGSDRRSIKFKQALEAANGTSG